MKLYPKESYALLSDLVRAANPALKVDLNAQTAVVLEPPSGTKLGTSGRNTRIRLNGALGSGTWGKTELFYDRINLSTLYPFPLRVSLSPDFTTVGDALPELNDIFGLSLTAADLTNPNAALGGGMSATSLVIPIASGSLAYTGSLTCSWRRKGSGFYPDSGPGPTSLIAGDEDMGYFGTVPAGQMPTGQEMFDGIFAGTDVVVSSATGSIEWMKFFFRGRVIFVPKTNMGATTWDNFYKAGSAYGMGDPNAVSNPGSDGVVVKQGKVWPFIKNGKTTYFHHRLPRGSTSILASSGTLDGEDYKLVSKVLGGEWGTETGTTFTGGGTYYMSQHILNMSQNQFFSIINMKGAIFGAAVNKNASYNYVPILELYTADDVLLPAQFTSTQNDQRRPPRLTIQQPKVDPAEMLLPVADVKGFTSVRRRPVVTYTVEPLVSVSEVRGFISTRRRPVVTATVVADTRTSLSTLKGDLDGFK